MPPYNGLETGLLQKSLMKKFLFTAASRTLFHPWSRLVRGMTLGVRICALRGGEVLLVRHTYAPGWLLPGGGVDRGETVFAAAVRELREETAVIAGETPQFHGLFSNDDHFPGNHVACFVIRQFDRQPWKPSFEISDARFFPVTDLPAEATGGTRRRIAEILDGGPVSHVW